MTPSSKAKWPKTDEKKRDHDHNIFALFFCGPGMLRSASTLSSHGARRPVTSGSLAEVPYTSLHDKGFIFGNAPEFKKNAAKNLFPKVT